MAFRQFTRQFTTRSRVLLAEPTAGGKGILNLRFSTPTATLFDDVPVFRVTIPAVTGDMGVTPDHVPTIAQLRPGVVTVLENEGTTEGAKWFVPGGFAVISSDSTASITAVDAIPMEDLDFARAEAALSKAKAQLEAAKDDEEKAEAAIGVEVLEAITRVKV